LKALRESQTNGVCRGLSNQLLNAQCALSHLAVIVRKKKGHN